MRPEPRPLGTHYETYVAPAEPAQADSITYPRESPTGILTLPRALSLALLHNPELAAFSHEIRAAEARALQATLYPNPELGIELENIGGSGSYSGFKSSETTIGLSQLILLGGKRAKATQAAALKGDLAAWDYEIKRLDVITAVRKAFLDVLAAQQSVSLNEDLVELSDQLVKTISKRVRAGKSSPAEQSRARVMLSATQVELQRSRRELEAARRQLAATWAS
ncbi:MAG: TolC family protein, partial [Bacteroidetes bacterium]|nr:TolC family protein [Bacteroidota bacterium]